MVLTACYSDKSSRRMHFISSKNPSRERLPEAAKGKLITFKERLAMMLLIVVKINDMCSSDSFVL